MVVEQNAQGVWLGKILTEQRILAKLEICINGNLVIVIAEKEDGIYGQNESIREN